MTIDIEHDLDGVPTERLEAEVCSLAAQLTAGEARFLLLVGELDRRAAHEAWGLPSLAHWLGWHCGIGGVAAREKVRVARALPELPLVREAFLSGRLSYSKVRAITRVATPSVERELVDLALASTAAMVERICRAWSTTVAQAEDSARRQLERRRVVDGFDDDGGYELSVRLPADSGALTRAALRKAMGEIGADPSRTFEQRRADAFDLVMAAYLAGDATTGSTTPAGVSDTASSSTPVDGPPTAGSPVPVARPSTAARSVAAEVVVHADPATFSGDGEGSGRCHLEGGPAIAPSVAQRLACDAVVVAAIEADGDVLRVGTPTRSIPSGLRRAVRLRDGQCRFPGCTHAAWLDLHHVTPRSHHGPTNLENLASLCRYHHRLVHEGGFTMTHDGEGAFSYATPAGTPLPTVPPARSATTSIEDANATAARTPAPDALMPQWYGERLDLGLITSNLWWVHQAHASAEASSRPDASAESPGSQPTDEQAA